MCPKRFRSPSPAVDAEQSGDASPALITELFPNRPSAPKYGCDCHDQLCSDTKCACFQAGEECTIRCFCSGFDANASELKWLEHADNGDDDWEDPDKQNWKHVCDNKYSGFETTFSRILNAINVFESRSQCFEIYLEKERQSLEVFSRTGLFHHMLGMVFAMIAHMSPDAWQRRPGIAHVLSPTEVQGLANSAHLPRQGDDVAVQGIRQLLAWSRPGSDARIQAALNLVQQAVKDGDTHLCFCKKKWVRKNRVRSCWACKRCFSANSWHCEACNECVKGKHIPCQGCGGVSIEAGDAAQLPKGKRRAIEQERSFRLAVDEYCDCR